MRISRVGGVIAAASQKDAMPMLQIGSIPIVRRIVISFQQAGIFPIVIITGVDEEEVKSQLSDFGVIFIPNEHSACSELFDSAKIGIRYLQGKCDRIVFSPVNVPMFTPNTLNKLICAEGDVVSPSYHGRAGHPLVLSENVLNSILAYDGGQGLRGALAAVEHNRTFVTVEDKGILTSVHNEQELQAQLAEHNQAILHPRVQLSFERETSFFDARLKLLLFLISDTRNMRKACEAMALSYGKAWSMINRLEQELGYFVVARTQGGKRGGSTCLTEKGEAFLRAYQQYEESVFQFTQSKFHELFILSKIM